MRAMILTKTYDLHQEKNPLRLIEIPVPRPGPGEILVRVLTCGVCHTELDEIEGRTPPNKYPRVLGHQIIGIVAELGSEAHLHQSGDRVGVGWIFDACGSCEYCLRGDENLCSQYLATGRDADGGYAEFLVIPERSAYSVPSKLSAEEAAPLLCAGAIGYRSLRLTGLQDGQYLGLTGFGSSAHLVLKTVRYLYPNVAVYVFSRNSVEQDFARELGAVWAGGFDDPCPEKLHCMIDTTPVWKPVVAALRNLAPGGRLVINAIRKEDSDKSILTELDYPIHLWLEKEIKSVANLSRRDAAEFLQIAAEAGIESVFQSYPLEEANRALLELKNGQIRGAKVLRVADSPL